MANEIASVRDINIHFDHLDLDIRASRNARWIDQKVTPDILSAISEAILSHRQDSPDEEFTMRTLWNDPKLDEIMRDVFSKPSLNNPSASNEYDKVISQPLRALAYANIISMEKGREEIILSLILILPSSGSLLTGRLMHISIYVFI